MSDVAAGSEPEPAGSAASDVPPNHRMVLTVLIIGAVVANVNLGISNVALPTIGAAFGATEPVLNLIGVAFVLGLASSVLYLGAVADRFGRKRSLLTGTVLSIPLSLVAAWAPTLEVLVIARFLGGVAAGLMFPTTLSLIALMFHGHAKTKAIALWSGIGGGCATLGPVVGGFCLVRFWWGSVFLPTAVLSVVVVLGAVRYLPSRAGDRAASVDHPGGVLSVAFIGPLVLGITLVPDFGWGPQVLALFAVAGTALVAFVIVERLSTEPLFDFGLFRVRTYWPAILAGTVLWGSLLGAKFIGQQFMQYVLGYDTFRAALNGLPAGLVLIIVARPAARLIQRLGGKASMLLGLGFAFAGFIAMAVLFRPGVSSWVAACTYMVVALGSGFAGPPSSNALMRSVPARRAGMGSASNDLQRDFGGALFQAVMGSILAVQYSRSFNRAFATIVPAQPSSSVQDFTRRVNDSFIGAEDVARAYAPADAAKILAAARDAFTQGKSAALALAVAATLVAFVVVAVWFPRKSDELRAYDAIARADAATRAPVRRRVRGWLGRTSARGDASDQSVAES